MRDIHSFARPEEAIVRHLALDLDVDFAQRRLAGSATLTIETQNGARELVLDTHGLTIDRVTFDDGTETTFALGEPQSFLGSALTIAIKPETTSVKIDYAASPEAAAVQWLSPEQTAGGKDPFLFTQSQAILARTWVPCQDSPGVRMTYEATVRVPRGLVAIMSAGIVRAARTRLTLPLPRHSLVSAALAGAISSSARSARSSGVWAGEADDRPRTSARRHAEDDRRRGERNGRSRGLRSAVLPPSFVRRMEKPRDVATPADPEGDGHWEMGVAHELEHSWRGNCPNASGRLLAHRGFPVYLERRIMERSTARYRSAGAPRYQIRGHG